MQTIKAYFEGKETKILAYIVGISDATSGIRTVGYNEAKTVYSVPLKIFSGISNPIKIQCLNSDQKRINVSNANIQVGLFAVGTQNELITVNASNIDAVNGVVEVIFTPSQLAPLDFGPYEIAMTCVDANLVPWPIFIDDNFGSRLTTTLMKGPVLAYADPTPVTFLDIVDVGVTSNPINLTNRPMNSTLATLCANLINYSGNVISQASLVTIPSPTDWANVSATYYSNVSGLIFQNVPGSFAMLRFVLDSIDPGRSGNLSPSNISAYINGANIRI